MSVQEGLSDIGYCEPEDVLDYFEGFEDIDETSNPSRSRVEAMILSWSDYIDHKTGHAWRARQVVNEFHELDTPYYYWAGKPLKLAKREIREFKEEEGDEISVWRGNGYENMVSDDRFTQGRDGDYWVDSANGILYIYRRLLFPRTKGVRVTYRFGHGTDENDEETIPRDIRLACAKFVAADLLRSETYNITVPGSDGGSDNETTAAAFEEEAEEIINRRMEVKTYGTS